MRRFCGLTQEARDGPNPGDGGVSPSEGGALPPPGGRGQKGINSYPGLSVGPGALTRPLPPNGIFPLGLTPPLFPNGIGTLGAPAG